MNESVTALGCFHVMLFFVLGFVLGSRLAGYGNSNSHVPVTGERG